MFSTNFLFGRKNEGNRSQTAVGGWAVRSGAVLGGQWEVGGGWSIASADRIIEEAAQEKQNTATG